MNTPLFKTMLVLLMTVTAFNLGRYSIDFSGRWSAWVAAIAFGVVMILSLTLLIRDFWKS